MPGEVERPVKAAGQLLELTAGWAKDLGIARYVVDGDEMKDAYAPYGLEPSQVRAAPPDRFSAHAERL